MKKTMIAMAVAGVVAAPIASADVAVSGKIEQTFTSTDSTTAATNELINGTDAWINFSASEDLGNGMTAFASTKLDIDQIEATANNAGETQDIKVGLTGGFGTLAFGRMEDFSESKVLSMVDVLAGTSVELGGDNAGRNGGGVAYILPAMNGLTLAAAGYVLNDTANDIDDFDATDIAAMYSNGPLTLNLSMETYYDDTGSDDEEIVSLGAGYTAGDLSLAMVYQDLENAGTTAANDHQDLMATMVYNMGNNSVALGYSKNELTTGTTDDKIVALEYRHKFSARTRAYVGATQDDSATVANETDTIYAGMEHTF